MFSRINKSKSTGALNISRKYKCSCDNSDSEYSGACIIIDNRSNISSSEKQSDATYHVDDEGISVLERKVTKLTEMLLEQHELLVSLKDELMSSKVFLNNITTEKPDLHRDIQVEALETSTTSINEVEPQENNKAKNLLDAIELSEVHRTDRDIKSLLTKFLQSDDLKDRIATATAESVTDVISTSFSETFPAVYMPILEQYHRRLLNHVTKTLETAFNELEAGSGGLFKSVHRTSRSLRFALEKHQNLLESSQNKGIFDNFQNSLELVLKNELKEWREKLTEMLLSESTKDIEQEINQPEEAFAPVSPPQPADPERSIIDQLMKSAQINKQINEGDYNKSFEEALCSADLSLVMAACKAADPAKIFSPPCCLEQCVLLSLIQQLATDMVHDTQLKCRYLEEAIINLNTSDPITREHLPLVVAEVRKHLSKFLRSYPSHIANRRITLIIMAANNLMK